MDVASPSNLSSIQMIRDEYLNRLKKNPSYSLNAFARDLGISNVQLSRILNGNRRLTQKQALVIAHGLGLDTKTSQAFLKGSDSKQSTGASVAGDITHFEMERFKLISGWIHYALLNLIFVKGFKPEPTWMAKRLGVSTIEIKDALERLIEVGLLSQSANGRLTRTKNHIQVHADRPDPAMRVHTEQMIGLAQKAIKDQTQTAFDRRWMSGATFPAAKTHVPQIKKMISDFQDKIIALIKKGPHEEVYQLNCQLFPLTTQEKSNEK